MSDKTRQKILRSAQNKLINEGFSAVTHRSVAEDANVPLGSTTYHFTDKSALINEAMRSLIEAERVRRQGLKLPSKLTVNGIADYILDLLVPPKFRNRETLGNLYERILQANRNPTLRELVAEDQIELSRVLRAGLLELEVDLQPELVQAIFDGRAMQWLCKKDGFESLQAIFREDIRRMIRP